MKSFILLSLIGAIAASPCPYGELAERGALSEEGTANFLAARSGGEAAIESQIKAKREAEHAEQEQFYKRQLSVGELPLGGGLLNGVLKPFSGILQGIDIPT